MADLALARKVLETEAAAILALVARLDERFDRAVELLRDCHGRVILAGMGKSGIICRKIAATLTSTGTPAMFLHPADAIHDALAMTLLVEKGFGQQDFVNLHPGGKLGKRLMRVESLMHGGQQCPIVRPETRMRDVIYEMSSKGLGMTCVVDGGDALL